MKELIGIIAVILTFVGYVPYIQDTISGKTKPHVYTWFIWGFITLLAFGLQISDHAGPGAFVTLAAAIVCLFIFVLGFFKRGDTKITKSDTAFLIAALIAMGIWLFADQPVLSVVLLSIIDMLGFGPTIRKSWNKPYGETLISYEINTFRFCLALLALNNYTLITTLYPATWVLANGLFSIFLIVRRRQVKV